VGGFLVVILASAGTVLATGWLFVRIARTTRIVRWGPPLGLLFGFTLGHWLLFPGAALAPKRNWHWLPLLVAIASLAGIWNGSASQSRLGAWPVRIATASLAAWLLVPTWADLSPARPVQWPLLALLMLSLMAGLDRLASRTPNTMAWFSILASWLALIGLIGIAVSLTLAKLAAVAAVCAASCAILEWAQAARTGQGVLPTVSTQMALLAVAMGYIGSIEPDPPLWCLLGLVLIPLLHCLFYLGPSRDERRTSEFVGPAIAVIAAIALVSCLVLTR
jgi:hypothetical protein